MAGKTTSDNENKSNLKNNKRLRKESTYTTMTDRLTDLPESLQLRILSYLDVKQAVQTSVLSKSWVSTWTYIPVLNFSSFLFQNLRVFDKFVFKALSVHQSVRLDKLTFKRDKICSAKILMKVFDYAFSHGVKELEAQIAYAREGKGWPILLHTSSDSLTSLKLEIYSDMNCSLLGPRSGCFKNLTNLHLRRVDISDPDLISRFPSLQRLKIFFCRLSTINNTLNIHALQLSELSISYCAQYVSCLQLTTPKLRYFNYQGIYFPEVKTQKSGLPILDTVVIDYSDLYYLEPGKIMFDDLLKLFDSFCNAKSLTMSSSIVHLLSLFLEDLDNRRSPFRDLKCLNMDFSLFDCQKLFQGPSRSLDEALGVVSRVQDYFLQKAHGAKCRIIHPSDSDVGVSSQCNIIEV